MVSPPWSFPTLTSNAISHQEKSRLVPNSHRTSLEVALSTSGSDPNSMCSSTAVIRTSI